MKTGLTTTAFALWAAVKAPFAAAQTISEIVQESEDFETLEAFLDAAGLLGVLNDPSLGATVFAPTDTAFEGVDADTAAKLLTNEWIEHTQCILTYHVVSGIVPASALSEGQVVDTLQGESFSVTLDPAPGIVAIGSEANIIDTDIEASNGLIHVVDNVLLPTCFSSNIAEVADASGSFDLLVEFVGRAGLVDALTGPGPLTVFAPTDDAFLALGEDTIAFLRDDANVNFLRATLLHHVFDGNIYSSTIPAEYFTTTSLQGTTAYVNGEQGWINNVDIVDVDILASNGVIHVIDEVMLLPSINSLVEDFPVLTGDAFSFTGLAGALDLAGLGGVFDIDDVNDPTQYTLLAPSDDALDPVPELLVKFSQPEWVDTHLTAVLLYHVIAGAVDSTVVAGLDTAESVSGQTLDITTSSDGIMINDANVVSADNTAYNGIIHAIDKLLVPESMTKTILELAVSNEDFSSLVGALQLTGLDQALTGEPFTVFAPTNAAFEALGLPADPDVDLVTQVLLYHVVDENIVATDGLTVETLQGSPVVITEGDDGLKVNDANIAAVVPALNGIIYVIDAVLIPQEEPEPEMVVLTPVSYPGCLQALDGARDGKKTRLAACDNDDASQQWSYEPSGLFRSMRDENQCLQAGLGGPPEDGTMIRTFECDSNDPLQLFDWPSPGPIKLIDNPELCLVFRGVTPNIGVDPMILKECSVIEAHEADRLPWEANN